MFETSVTINLLGTLGGRNVRTRLDYYLEEFNNTIPSSAVALAAQTLIWNNLKTLLTNEFRMLTLTAQIGTWEPPILKPSYQVSIDEGGDITDSETMPGYSTVVLLLYPSQTNFRPDPGRLPGLAWRGFSGIPESANNNGLLTDAAMTDWRAFGEAIETLTVSYLGTDYDFKLGMVGQGGIWGDPPENHPTVWAVVEETDVSQAFGTRVTRRRR